MTEVTIEIPVQMERVSAMIAETLLLLYQNQKRRLRLLFDSCFYGASRMGDVGDFLPNPLPGDIVPRPLYRFAPMKEA